MRHAEFAAVQDGEQVSGFHLLTEVGIDIHDAPSDQGGDLGRRMMIGNDRRGEIPMHGKFPSCGLMNDNIAGFDFVRSQVNDAAGASCALGFFLCRFLGCAVIVATDRQAQERQRERAMEDVYIRWHVVAYSVPPTARSRRARATESSNRAWA